MAKYLDQTGAQHLAEALMASTKTVGGQTIWGSGNIEAGGGDNVKVYVISGDAEWWENATALASYDFKVVYLSDETGTIGSTPARTYVLRNALVYVIGSGGGFNMVMGLSNSTMNFENCIFTGSINSNGDIYKYSSILFNHGNFNFNNCILYLSTIGTDTTGLSSILTFDNTCVYGDLDSPPRIDANSNVVLRNSSVLDGIFFETNTKIAIYAQTQYSSFTRAIHHKFTRCFIGEGVTFTATGDTAKYVSFNQCDIHSTTGVVQLYNVTNCQVAYGPDEWCHPSIFDNQAIGNTADGGFNKIN